MQQLNAANPLEVARKDEQNARTELASLLRMEQLPADLALLSIPDMLPPVSYTSEEVVKLALSNSPAYQHQLAELLKRAIRNTRRAKSGASLWGLTSIWECNK